MKRIEGYMLLYWPLTRKRKIQEVEKRYEEKLGYKPDLKNPLTFNEKIQWLKLNFSDPRMKEGADKLTVKKMVAEQIGDKYIVPTIGVYDRAEDINWSSLPEKFVVKVSDGYSQNIICTNKDTFDIEEATKKLSTWLKPMERIYWREGSYQSQYRNTRPRILIEEYIGDKDNQIHEYKFMYLSGKLAFIMVTTERSLERASDVKITHFDDQWKRLDLRRKDHPLSDKDIPRPKMLAKMLEVSEKLAQNFPVCRVDLYEVGKSLKVGELTFTPADGYAPYAPDEWNLKLGSMVELPKRNDFTFLEWKPLEIYPKDWLRGKMNKQTLKRLVKASMPHGLLVLHRRHKQSIQNEGETTELSKNIEIKFLGSLPEYRVLDIMRQRGSSIHFGQSAEDAVLNRIFRGKRGGFYVDIGAFHPTKFSNTFLFHEFLGWKGINIDASRQAVELFEERRPSDINLNLAIGEDEGTQELTVYSDPARNTLSDKGRLRQEKRGDVQVVQTESVKVHPLQKILDEHLPRDTQIDILDIDIEGYDLQALKTNDWNRYRPSVILIEDYAINTTGFSSSEIYDFMNRKGYRFFSHVFDTSIYIESNFDIN